MRGNGRAKQFVDIRVKDTIHKSDGGRFVGILVREFDMDFPSSAGEGGYLLKRGFSPCIMPWRWGWGLGWHGILSSGPLKRTKNSDLFLGVSGGFGVLV